MGASQFESVIYSCVANDVKQLKKVLAVEHRYGRMKQFLNSHPRIYPQNIIKRYPIKKTDAEPVREMIGQARDQAFNTGWIAVQTEGNTVQTTLAAKSTEAFVALCVPPLPTVGYMPSLCSA